jgi:tetratricopeptide (TPR) repeat protein
VSAFPPDLNEVARLKEGDLSLYPFAVLLLAFFRQKRSLVLELKRKNLEKRVVFEDGIPVECESNLLHETLGKFLVKGGKLNEEDYQKALNAAASSGEAMGEVLLKLELISAFDLFKNLQSSLAHKLLEVFSWEDGAFKISGDLPETESSLKVNVPQLVLTGVMRFLPQVRVDTAITAYVGKALALHPEEESALKALRLNAKQSRVVQELAQHPRIDQLLALGVLEPPDISRLVFALGLLGVVCPADQVPQKVAAPETTKALEKAPEEKASPPPAAQEAVASLSPEQIAVKKEALMAFFLNHRKLDAFDLLGAKPEDQSDVLKEKYLAYAKRYAPWQFQGAELSGLAEKAQELFFAGAKAFSALTDPDQRGGVITRRKNREKRPRGNPHAFAIKTDLLDADSQFKKGMTQKRAGNFGEAVKLFEFAVDCDQQNGTYRAELAYCRFLDRAELAADALKELLEAFRIDPKAGIALFYAGEISVATGDRAGAHAYYNQAAMRMPNDERPKKALADL